jgi:MFS family permease
MIREPFLGHKPSHYLQVDPIVKAYIVSECFLWSSWSFITPIFAIFATQNIVGSSIELAASIYSCYFIARVVAELISARFFSKKSDRSKIITTISGLLLLSCAWFAFSFATNILQLFSFYALAGIGLGLAAPAKNALFSIHLDKNKEASEWSIADASSFISMALATALGGFIAAAYGFRLLFIIAGLVNLFAIPPYLLYLNRKKRKDIE